MRDACVASGAAADRLTLKWPNDVLLGGAKLSGLLIEFLDGAAPALAIGIGVNLAAAPDGLPYEATALSGAVRRGEPRPTMFLAHLDAAFLARMGEWRTQGFGALRAAWLDAAEGLGKPVTVRLPNETLTGVFEAIGPVGALRLRTAQGVRDITAGDVFFPHQSG